MKSKNNCDICHKNLSSTQWGGEQFDIKKKTKHRISSRTEQVDSNHLKHMVVAVEATPFGTHIQAPKFYITLENKLNHVL